MDGFQDQFYDPSSDRLFLVYYALDDSINLNGWRVSSESLEKNIKSFVGKPVVLKRKDPFNPADIPQTGKFVHPILKNASLDENLEYQEQYSVGRINKVFLNPRKGWRFDVEITDPGIKQALKADTFSNGSYPRHVSPQIATFPEQYPQERDDNVNNWYGLHLALVDVPAYGLQKSEMKGKCYGTEQQCTIKLRSAAAETTEIKENEPNNAALNTYHISSLERKFRESILRDS